MNEGLLCSICLEPFSQSRVPLLLQCGHTFCSLCLTSMHSHTDLLRCPLDRSFDPKLPEDLRPNITLLQLINSQLTKPKPELCKTHQKSLNYICITCKLPFCLRCLSSHNFHEWVNYKYPEDVQKFIEAKDFSLQKQHGFIEELIKRFHDILERSEWFEGNIIRDIDWKAHLMKKEIERQKIEVLAAVNEKVKRFRDGLSREIKGCEGALRDVEERRKGLEMAGGRWEEIIEVDMIDKFFPGVEKGVETVENFEREMKGIEECFQRYLI